MEVGSIIQIPLGDCSTDNICRDTEVCTYSHAEQKNYCACRDGYKKDEEGNCRLETETWCGGGKCVEHASCLYDADYQVHYCHCDHDYIGDGEFLPIWFQLFLQVWLQVLLNVSHVRWAVIN